MSREEAEPLQALDQEGSGVTPAPDLAAIMPWVNAQEVE